MISSENFLVIRTDNTIYLYTGTSGATTDCKSRQPVGIQMPISQRPTKVQLTYYYFSLNFLNEK